MTFQTVEFGILLETVEYILVMYTVRPERQEPLRLQKYCISNHREVAVMWYRSFSSQTDLLV